MYNSSNNVRIIRTNKYLSWLLFNLSVITTWIRLKIEFLKRLCGLAVKISKLRYWELFKMCVQSKQLVILVCFFSLLINIVRQNNLFKASKRLLLRLFIINQYCTPNVCFIIKNLFKASERLFFSLLSYLSDMKKMCIQIK